MCWHSVKEIKMVVANVPTFLWLVFLLSPVASDIAQGEKTFARVRIAIDNWISDPKLDTSMAKYDTPTYLHTPPTHADTHKYFPNASDKS